MNNEQQIIETLTTKLMGWEKRDMLGVSWANKYGWFAPDGQFKASGDWNPLQNIADAWQVVEKIESMGMAVEIYTETYAPRECKVWLDCVTIAEGEGETIQEAICIAGVAVANTLVSAQG